MKVFIQVAASVVVGAITLIVCRKAGADEFVTGLITGFTYTAAIFIVGDYIEYLRS